MQAMAISCSRSSSKSGPVQIEPVTPRLLRVRPGSDQPSVLDGIRHTGGSLDGTRRCFWVDAFKMRQLEAELRVSADLFPSEARPPASTASDFCRVLAKKTAISRRKRHANPHSP